MPDKLPDSYVENRSSKEYPTEVGSPNFKPTNLSLFSQENSTSVRKYYSSKLSEIEKEYNKVVSEILINERLYSAKCSMKTNPGEIYHLYINNKGEEFLSIISPSEWNFEHIGTYRFLFDGRWEEVKEN